MAVITMSLQTLDQQPHTNHHPIPNSPLVREWIEATVGMFNNYQR